MAICRAEMGNDDPSATDLARPARKSKKLSPNSGMAVVFGGLWGK